MKDEQQIYCPYQPHPFQIFILYIYIYIYIQAKAARGGRGLSHFIFAQKHLVKILKTTKHMHMTK